MEKLIAEDSLIGSEMSALMRSFDWAKTPLDAVKDWSPSLRTAVGIRLNSRAPITTCKHARKVMI